MRAARRGLRRALGGNRRRRVDPRERVRIVRRHPHTEGVSGELAEWLDTEDSCSRTKVSPGAENQNGDVGGPLLRITGNERIMDVCRNRHTNRFIGRWQPAC